MNSPAVSVIMPVYNCETYLEEAIRSLWTQTFSNWELVAIDDGSTDKSSSILDVLASEDNRIKVIHQTNAGVAAARQAGLDNSIGKYVIHVDADDWVEPDYPKNLYETIETKQVDMVWCDVYVNETQYWKHQCNEDADTLIHAMLRQELWGTLYNRIWRWEICSQVRFLRNCTMWEDLSFLTLKKFN